MKPEPSALPRGLRFSITKLGWLIIFISLILGLSSISSQSGLLLVPIGVLVGCFLINIFSARNALANLRLTAPEIERAVEGRCPDRGWTAHNAGAYPLTGIEVSAAAEELFRIPCIEPGAVVHPVPRRIRSRRGVYEHGATVVSTRFPFGLVEVNRSLALAGRTIVHPDVYPVGTPAAAGFDVMVGGKYRGQRQSASGDSFAGVREHRPGDSLRQIHWASSAKGRGLMVRVYDEELSGRVGIVIDNCTGDMEGLDGAVRLAGSLAFAALDAGHHCEWTDLAGGRRRLVPPFEDGQELLDDLAELKIEQRSNAAASLIACVSRLSRKAALHLVLASYRDEVAEAVAELTTEGRKISVYLPEGVAAYESRAQRYAGKELIA